MSGVSFLSASCFFLFPFVLGHGVMSGIKLARRKSRVPGSVVFSFILGSLIIYSLAILDQYLVLPFWHPFQFHQTFFPAVYSLIGLSVLSSILAWFPLRRLQVGNLLQQLGPVFLSVIISLTAYSIWIFRSPYPLNWDLYEHQTLANLIQTGHFSFFTSRISDTFIFNGYSSMFHTLLAVAQFPFTFNALNILQFWNSMSLIQCILVSYAGYLLAKALTKNTHVAILSSLLSGLVFESVIIFTSLFFIPQTFTAVMFVFCLVYLLNRVSEKQALHPVIGIMCVVFLLLNHYVMGALAASIFVSSYVFLHYPDFVKKVLSMFPIIEVGTLLVLFLLAYSFRVNLGFINHGEAASYTFSLAEKFQAARQIYGYLLFIFFPLGAVYVISAKHKDKLVFFLLWTLAMLAGIISQYPYVLKFYVITRFFVHVFMALGMWSLLRFVHNRVLRFLGYCAVYGVLSAILIFNAFEWKHSLSYGELLTHISPGEIEAADFLQQHYANQPILMVSDPATQYILEALSGVNSPGGAYADPSTRNQLMSIPNAASPAEVRDDVMSIHDRVTTNAPRRLLVLSGRYFVWQTRSDKEKMSLDFNVWSPSNLSFADQAQVLQLEAEPAYFHPVFQNQTLVILEVQ